MTNQFTELETIADEELLAASGGIAFVPAAIGVGKFIAGLIKPAATAAVAGAATYGGYKAAEEVAHLVESGG